MSELLLQKLKYVYIWLRFGVTEQKVGGLSPQHRQVAADDPLSEAPNPVWSRGAVSRLTLGPDPSFLWVTLLWGNVTNNWTLNQDVLQQTESTPDQKDLRIQLLLSNSCNRTMFSN